MTRKIHPGRSTAHRPTDAGRPLRRWTTFALLSLSSIALAAMLLLATLHADAFDGHLDTLTRWLFAHPVVMVTAALSPLGCSLVVGLGYARRARRRKRAAAQPATADPRAGP